MQIPNLIKIKMDGFLADIEDKGFNQAIRWRYGKTCRLFAQWACEQHFKDVSEESLRRYALKVVGYWEAARNLPLQKRLTLMVLRRWSNFLRGMPYEYRIPAKDYRFSTAIGNWIGPYLDWCIQSLLRRPETINSKKRILFRLDIFLSSEGLEVANINIGNVDKHFMSLPLGQRKSHKSTIREFLHYLYSNDLLPVNLSGQILKEPRRRRPERLPSVYSTEEVKQLLKSVDQSTSKGKRDYLVLLLCAQYGLRASDIVRLKLDNFNWEKNIIRVRQYKTDVDIELPLLASVGNAVINYLKHGHPSPNTGILVVSHMRTTVGQPLDRATIHSIVTAAFRNSNITGWQERRHGPHSLRHSLASNLIKQEVSLMTISAALGHKSAESTRVYIKIDIDGLRKCGLAIPTMSNLWISGPELEAAQR